MTYDHGSLRQRVVQGISWNASARVVQQIIQFLLSVLLARLLTPEEFGTVGLILVFTGFARLFVDAGFGAAIVQRQEVNTAHLNSAFWMSLGLGALITLLLVAVAPLISDFYNQPHLTPLIRFAALNFLVIPIGMVPAALMQKQMVFGRLAQIEIISTVFSGLYCAGLALAGWGVWSLLGQAMALNMSTTLLKWYASRWQPGIAFNIAAFRDLWSYSANLLGFNIINYWARNGDNLLIGRFLGSAPLGIYTRAYSLMLLPISQVMNVVASVMFSALSAIQEDKARVKRIYLEAMARIGFIIFPIMIGLSVVAEPFVLTVYGEKWTDVIPILQILALVGLVQSMMNPVGWLYTSQGYTGWLFWWGVFGAGFQILTILIGALSGSLVTLSQVYALGNLLLFYPAIAIPGRFVEMTFMDFIGQIYRPLFTAALMGAIVWVWSASIVASWPMSANLISSTVIGMVTYTSIALLWQIPTAHQALSLVRKRLLVNNR